MSSLERAIAIAAEAHRGKKDKAEAPYILHPLRVMFEMTTDEERIVAVLHDVVEDSTAWSLQKLRAEGFSNTILEAIDSVTNRQDETYDDFIERARRNPIGRRVKIADVRDNLNLNRIAQPTGSDYARLEKYRGALTRLQETVELP